jgi:hypothetical protein
MRFFREAIWSSPAQTLNGAKMTDVRASILRNMLSDATKYTHHGKVLLGWPAAVAFTVSFLFMPATVEPEMGSLQF